MASAISSVLPAQQQPTNYYPQSVSSSGTSLHSNSGSIGPFFAVISVLAVLSIISCIVGRRYTRERSTTKPPSSAFIHGGGCFGLMKRKCSHCCWWCGDRDVEMGAKVVNFGARDLDKSKDGDVQQS